jgi:hypothetical protein
MVKISKQHSTLILSAAGLITILEWTDVMERVLELRLPWGMIRKHVAIEMKDGKVDYESCLDRYHIEAMFSKVNVKTLIKT